MAKKYERDILCPTLFVMHASGQKLTPLTIQAAMGWTDKDHKVKGIKQEMDRTWMSLRCEYFRSERETGITRQIERRDEMIKAGWDYDGKPVVSNWIIRTGPAHGDKNCTGGGSNTLVTGHEDYTAQFDQYMPKIGKGALSHKVLWIANKIAEKLQWLARWEVVEERVSQIPPHIRAEMCQISLGASKRYHGGGISYRYGPPTTYIEYWENIFHIKQS